MSSASADSARQSLDQRNAAVGENAAQASTGTGGDTERAMTETHTHNQKDDIAFVGFGAGQFDPQNISTLPSSAEAEPPHDKTPESNVDSERAEDVASGENKIGR